VPARACWFESSRGHLKHRFGYSGTFGNCSQSRRRLSDVSSGVFFVGFLTVPQEREPLGGLRKRRHCTREPRLALQRALDDADHACRVSLVPSCTNARYAVALWFTAVSACMTRFLPAVEGEARTAAKCQVARPRFTLWISRSRPETLVIDSELMPGHRAEVSMWNTRQSRLRGQYAARGVPGRGVCSAKSCRRRWSGRSVVLSPLTSRETSLPLCTRRCGTDDQPVADHDLFYETISTDQAQRSVRLVYENHRTYEAIYREREREGTSAMVSRESVPTPKDILNGLFPLRFDFWCRQGNNG